MMRFTDRPNRHGSFTELSTFIDQWNSGANSFTTNPPNAGLVALPPKADGSQTQLMITLTNPEYDAHAGTLTFTITSIDPTQPIPAGPLLDTFLFIDNVWSTGFK